MMGTNYYLVENDSEAVCSMCGKPNKEPWRYHIGKSSGGWCFALHVDAAFGINSLDDLMPYFEDSRYRIEDEYGDVHSAAEMLLIITKRYWRDRQLSEEFLRRNHAIIGPNGLLRSISKYCAGHGEGTWDYHTGEFS